MLSNGKPTVSYDYGNTWEDIPGYLQLNRDRSYDGYLGSRPEFFVDNNFAIMNGSFMNQGSCKWSEIGVSPFAGSSSAPYYLIPTVSNGVIDYFDIDNTNIYPDLPSSNVTDWAEYKVFIYPDNGWYQTSQPIDTTMQAVLQKQGIDDTFLLSVRFVTDYQYDSSNITVWDNYYINLDYTADEYVTTTQSTSNISNSQFNKILIFKNILFILNFSDSTLSTSSLKVISVNRLVGNPIYDLIPIKARPGNTLDELQNVGSDGITSAYNCYDMSAGILELIDLEENGIVVDSLGQRLVGLRGGHGDRESQAFTPQISQDTSFYVSSSDRYEVIKFGYVDSWMGFRVASSNNYLNLPNFISIADTSNASNVDGYGEVSSSYFISKYPVTNSEYVEFLNSQATYQQSLWSSNMDINNSAGVYSSFAGMGNVPVTNITWERAAKYCNWLHSGKANSFVLNDNTASYTGVYLDKNPLATYYIPTENEWYKAAYYDPNKGGQGIPGYWNYATSSDNPPNSLIKTLTSVNDICIVTLNNSHVKVFLSTDKGLFSKQYADFSVSSLLTAIQDISFQDSNFNQGSWTQIFNNKSTFVNYQGNGIILTGINGNLWISYDNGQNFSMILNNGIVKKAFISNKINFYDCRGHRGCSECGDSIGYWDVNPNDISPRVSQVSADWILNPVITQSLCTNSCGGSLIPDYYGSISEQTFFQIHACNECYSSFGGYVYPDNYTGAGAKLPMININNVGRYYLTAIDGSYNGVSYNSGVYLMIDYIGTYGGSVGIVELPASDTQDLGKYDYTANICRDVCTKLGQDCLWTVIQSEFTGKCLYQWDDSSWFISEDSSNYNELCTQPDYDLYNPSADPETNYEGILLSWTTNSTNSYPQCCECVPPTRRPINPGDSTQAGYRRLSSLQNIW
jgi:hypothetical protein